MAHNNISGKPYDQVLCEAAALPNATAAKISSNVVTLDAAKSGTIWVRVYASNNAGTGTTVELAGGATLEFRPYVGLTAAACTTVLPGIIMTQAVTTDVSWAAGELICEFAIPKILIGANRYMELYAATSADESADFVEAYTYAE